MYTSEIITVRSFLSWVRSMNNLCRNLNIALSFLLFLKAYLIHAVYMVAGNWNKWDHDEVIYIVGDTVTLSGMLIVAGDQSTLSLIWLCQVIKI